MKILIAHNRYRLRAGEDTVFDQEVELLRAHGHEVTTLIRDNLDLTDSGLRRGLGTIWSTAGYRDLLAAVSDSKPHLVHVHNTLPLLSPAIYFAAERSHVPVVQTLHNYRLACAAGNFVRDGRLCEDCLGKAIGWPAVVHRCYRNDYAASTAVVASTSIHKALGTWNKRIATFIALTNYARTKLIEAGLPAEKIVVKPNFAEDRFGAPDDRAARSGGLYFGRLSTEKGVDVLLDAWQGIGGRLTVFGTGPLEESFKQRDLADVDMRGFAPRDALDSAIRAARFALLPSTNYEGFPMVIAEAFSAATPIIASRIGSLPELVEDGVTGLLFEPGNTEDLRAKIRWAFEHPAEIDAMGNRARKIYDERYSPDRAHASLLRIYELTLAKVS